MKMIDRYDASEDDFFPIHVIGTSKTPLICVVLGEEKDFQLVLTRDQASRLQFEISLALQREGTCSL